MTELYKINDLNEIAIFLKSKGNTDTLRETLFTEFLKYSNYKNVSEWNKAVKLCESLTIIGWGYYEPLEAIRGMYFNGNPMTQFFNKYGELRFVDAIWSKRKTGYTMEQDRTSYHFSPDQRNQKKSILWKYETKENIQDLTIQSQRNWIPKNPVWIERTISTCYKGSKVLLKSIKNDLQPALNKTMRPEKYGNALNRIIINHSHSYYDNSYCKTNFIFVGDLGKPPLDCIEP